MKRGREGYRQREGGKRAMARDRKEGKETQRVRETRKKEEGGKGGGERGEARET